MSGLAEVLNPLYGSILQPKSPKTKGGGIRHVLAKAQLYSPETLVSETITGKSQRSLSKSLKALLDGSEDSVERLAFERDPQRIAEYSGVWRPKLQLIPDNLLKRMAIQDDLVAAVVHTRSNHIAQFGRKQPDRHSKGFILEIDKSIQNKLDEKQKAVLQERITRAEKLILTCGHTEGWSQKDRCSFSEYLYMTARNAVVFGRQATEPVYVPDTKDPSKKKFHSFRPTDAGTIYFAAPHKEAAESIRRQARKQLEQLKNEKLLPEKFENDEYSWVQVIDGRPLQAFASDEMFVQNFYPTTDVELQGYPLTPLDTAISAVTTHINITNHNKLYFQYGRAARGMLVIKSQDVDDEVVQSVKQNFNASINSVNNSYRMPVFGVAPDEELIWQPIDQGSRDMEYQFLSDSNARTILAAFQMSPEELPGYQHLSRGTNNQALAESNQEYKLTAARDVGIRPLIAKIEDFLNDCIMPLIDSDLSKYVKIRLVGLELDDAEKESVRLQQDSALHMTYDQILQKVEKTPLGKDKCGEFPLNPAIIAFIERYMTFGEILEKFRGIEGASQKPELQFYQNQNWMAWQEMQMKQQELAAQQQQAQQQPPTGPTQPQEQSDLSAGVDQLQQLLGKSEDTSLHQSRNNLRAHQKATNQAILDAWKQDSDKFISELVDIAGTYKPTPKKKSNAN